MESIDTLAREILNVLEQSKPFELPRKIAP
jgi:hypothetical protein